MCSSEATSTNSVVQPLLTDFYQVTMAYAYWNNNKMDEHAVFDLYFRKNPFKGEYTIFAGLSQCIEYIRDFKFTDADIRYLKSVMPDTTRPEFFEFLANLTCAEVSLSSVAEGSVVFPKTPLLRVEGPLAVVQLLETTLLNLVNYASLVTTNAARFRHAAGESKTLLEFGLRRAQGPDGGLSASRYCYMGGFDATSNVLAGKKFGIPVRGTHAHAFISSFHTKNQIPEPITLLNQNTNQHEEFLPVVDKFIDEISIVLSFSKQQLNRTELRAFVSYACAFPHSFVALIDTYDSLRSGLLNFIAVALALNVFGYRAQDKFADILVPRYHFLNELKSGIRIDSGDLAYIAKEIRGVFETVGDKLSLHWFKKLTIIASNDINEETLSSLEQQGHCIDAYGIGTHLVTCQKQPALGCVFKLVELNGEPRMKLSEDMGKVTIPGKKNLYRLYGEDGHALLDLMTRHTEAEPQDGEKVLCRHILSEAKRAYVKPSTVENLLQLYWKDGELLKEIGTLEKCRENVRLSLSKIRKDHFRALNPTPYKVSVTNELYHFMHNLWLECAPISELR